MMKALNALLSILLFPLLLPAQQITVSGTLRDSSGKVLPDITVMLTKSGNRVVAFSISNISGQYYIKLPTTTDDSLFLEISHLQFQSSRRLIQKDEVRYDFVLAKKVFSLPEVKARAKPVITTSGDTLSYNVSSFAKEEDRSIGDVLKRLPGITVADNGQISYNGQSISNLYIHGDDLMDGRYGLATKTINKEQIRSIDVIQNHQPVRVLQKKVRTDNVAINLVLKDENSIQLAGQAMLGAGLPAQADAAGNLILLNKRFKMINSLKANNSGIDYRNDFIQFGADNMLNDIGNSRPAALLSAGTAGNPDLPRSNYYLNKSAVGNFNNLINTSKELQWRSNVQVFVDRNTFNYSSAVENYLAQDTIRFREHQASVRTPWLTNAAFTLMSNKEKGYLKNSLQLNIGGETNTSNMELNATDFGQRLHNRLADVSNDFSWIPAVKNNGVMKLQWYFNYYRNSQQLYIDEGLNATQLNHGDTFSAIRQQAATPTYFSHVSLAYQVFGKMIAQEYQAGLLNERQQLNTDLQLTQLNGDVTHYSGDAGNALAWQRNRLYATAAYSIKKTRWDARLTVPLIWQHIRYDQADYLLDKNNTQVWVSPAASLKLSVSAEDNLSFTYAYNNSVGNIAGVYRGAVLTSYRNLMSNDALLQQRYSSGAAVQYNFRRSIIMLFMNAGIGYDKIGVNSILSSILTNNIQQTILLPYSNDQSRLSATAGISKYLFNLRTTASLRLAFRRERYEQFINDQLFPVSGNSHSVNAGIEGKLFNRVSVSYNGTAAWNTSRSAAHYSTTVNNIDQSITLGYTPLTHLFLQTKGRHIYTYQRTQPVLNYFFADAGIRYKLIKWRLDLECDITNIQNIKTYEVIRLLPNQLSNARYDIRGRMTMLRVTFNL